MNEHIQNIIEYRELPPESPIRKFRIVDSGGSHKKISKQLAKKQYEQFDLNHKNHVAIDVENLKDHVKSVEQEKKI